MATCNLTSRYQGFVRTQCLQLLTECEDKPRLFLHKSLDHVPIICCPNPDHFMNPHHCEHLISCNSNLFIELTQN